jgi:hypothetical protein
MRELKAGTYCLVIVDNMLRTGSILSVEDKQATVTLTCGKNVKVAKGKVALAVPPNALGTAKRMREEAS